MSDSVLIILIVAVAVVVVLYIFRRQLSSFFIKADASGIEAELTTHAPEGQPAPNQPPRYGSSVKDNIQKGRDHKIRTRGSDVEVSGNVQEGQRNVINIGGEDEE